MVFDHWSIHKNIRFSSQSFPSEQYCWRVFEDFHSQEYIQFFDIHRCLFMRLHFSIGCYDYRSTTRLSISASLKSFFADHMHWRAGVDNKFSFLRFQRWCRQAPIFRRWEECCSFLLLYFLTHFWPTSTLLREHLALATLSPPETDPQSLERWGYSDEVHLGKDIRAKDFGLEF